MSIASVAVDLARKIFDSLRGRTVFLVGAGKMSKLVARHLVQQGAGAILVSNRTAERARRMSEEIGSSVIPEVIDFAHLYEAASRADIVISSTGVPHPIFRPEHGRAFMHQRRNRPMFFIDITVPRDVDPEMNRLDGIFVYDIDDLEQVAALHMEERSRQAVDAEALIAARAATSRGGNTLTAAIEVAGVLPLGKIGNASAEKSCVSRGADPRRFRFAGKKEATGVCRGRGEAYGF